MSATKSRAYTTEFGSEPITAWAIRQVREKYGGYSLGKIYWSTHKLGQRKPMRQMQKGQTSFFAYANGAGATGGDGGESLTHLLFKEAIAGLSGTKLRLSHFGEHEITITHGETEKEIRTADGPYYADVYLRFTSTNSLGLKWSGEVYIEVNHTHAVPPYKQDSLRQARLPVVEVEVPKILEYPFDDEQTTDPREAAHVNWIQNMLQKGFLAGHVINDPSSIEYLEQKVAQLEQELQQTQQWLSAAKRKGDEALHQLKTASEREVRLQNTINDLAQQKKRDENIANDFGRKLATEEEKVRTLSKSLSEANETIEAQQKEVRLVNWIFWGMLALILCLCAFVLYQRFLAPRQDEAAPAVFPPPLQQVPPIQSGTDKTHKKVQSHPASH